MTCRVAIVVLLVITSAAAARRVVLICFNTFVILYDIFLIICFFIVANIFILGIKNLQTKEQLETIKIERIVILAMVLLFKYN